MFESLETRVLLTLVPVNNVIALTATDGNDSWEITQVSGILTWKDLNTGATDSTAAAFTGGLSINMGGGNDLLRLRTRYDTRAVTVKASISGGLGNDTIIGGDGRDLINGNDGDDRLDGDVGPDVLSGDNGFDTADYSLRTSPVQVTLDGSAVSNDGESGEADAVLTEAVLGGSGNDKLFGDGGANLIDGGAGNDTITGGAGNDTLTGGLGLDQVFGEDGNDFTFARDGTVDQLNDGAGTDSASIDSTVAGDLVNDVPTASAPPVPVAFAALAFSAPTGLGTLSFHLNSAGLADYVSLSLNGVAEVQLAGELNITRTGGTFADLPDVGETKNVYCVELNQPVYFGGDFTHQVVQPEDAPDPGALAGGAMGADEAKAVRELWFRFHGGIATGTDAAAFQCAIWEVVYDYNATALGHGLDLSSGMFTVNSTLSSAVYARAQQMLGALTGETLPAPVLYALSDPTYQDLIFDIPVAENLISPAQVQATTFQFINPDTNTAQNLPSDLNARLKFSLQDDGTLVINGTNDYDDIDLSADGDFFYVRINESLQTYDVSKVLRVVVNALGGNDIVTAEPSVVVPVTVNGGAGNDIIQGGSAGDELNGEEGNDIILGAVGNDKINGGFGRDVLIGGLGADNIDGGGDEDILIAGTTSYDGDFDALEAIRKEWSRTDRSYTNRIASLKGQGAGVGLNGNTFLKDNKTLFDDGAVDVLSGGLGQDYFLSDKSDVLTDLGQGEKVR